ncbi:MAG: peptidase domain-containing ABC transporter [Acidobacteria bacterium]|nr:peptidase domain-containing ABC transporter [Acidobacteriota bacterium]
MRSVPFLAQMTPSDCGPTCLAMLAQAHGVPLEPEGLRQECGSHPYGLSMAFLARLAQKHQLNPRLLEISDLAALGTLELPLLLFWRGSHFVVLERVRKGRFSLVDPEQGRMVLDQAQFQKEFSGLAMAINPAPALRKGLHRLEVYRRYAKKVWLFPGLVAKTLSYSVLLKLLGLVLPLVTAYLLDKILPQSDISQLQLLGWGLMAYLAAQFGVGLLRQWTVIELQVQTDRGLMRQFTQHLLRLPFAFFQARPVGDLIMRLNSLRTIRDLFGNQILAGLIDGGLTIIYFIFMWRMSPLLAGFAALLAAVQMGTSLFFFRIMDERVKTEILAQSRHQSFAVEALQAIQSIKAGGVEAPAESQWFNLLEKELKQTQRTQHMGALLQSIQQALSLFGPLFILWFGSTLVLNGSLTIGTVLAFNVLTGSFLGPLSALIGCLQQFQLIGSHLRRLDDIFKHEPEQKSIGKRAPFSGEISVSDVRFAYQSQGEPILDNLNVKIEAGQWIGIVGSSGSGKSTLAKLLSGLYQPDRGSIHFDQHALSDLDLVTLRQQIGSVYQESALMDGTLGQNIAFFEQEPDMERVHWAATLACISPQHHVWFRGYESPIGQGGSGLSGGQRQRILLARALYRQPRLLILDEATSQLDSTTENQIFSHLAELGMTRIVITHRLSTLRRADQIWVLQDGRIVESGAPQQLVNRNGLYSRMLAEQEVQPV